MKRYEKMPCAMKRYTRYFMTLFLVSALFFAFGQDAKAEDGTRGVVTGKSVFLHPKGVAFWGWGEEVWSGLVDESGNIYDYVKEGSMPSKVQTIAVDGNYLYLDTFDGLYRIDLTENGQDTSVARELYDSMLIRGFFVYDGYAYFMSGSSLYRVSVEGGDKEKLITGAQDCEVAEDGIYYTDEDGGLFWLSLDGSRREFLTDTEPESNLVLHDDFIYFWGEDEEILNWYTISSGELRGIQLKHELYTPDYIWAGDNYFIYNSAATEGWKFDMLTGQEHEVENFYGLMDKEKGLFQNDRLYYIIGDTLYCYDVANGEESKVTQSEVFENRSAAEKPAQKEPSENEYSQGLSDGYDIAANINLHVSQGFAFVISDYITLGLPADANWDFEVINDTTIKFFYPPAKEAGFGGTFVTIRAYDWGDNGYADIPSYKIAGLSDTKKYIAIFPTDVQYDTSDATQTSEYQRLLDFAYRIDDENSDNPFMVNAE